MRFPSSKNGKSSSVGKPGYGEPPSVNTSHSNIPNDQLEKNLKLVRVSLYLTARNNRKRHSVKAFLFACSLDYWKSIWNLLRNCLENRY